MLWRDGSGVLACLILLSSFLPPSCPVLPEPSLSCFCLPCCCLPLSQTVPGREVELESLPACCWSRRRQIRGRDGGSGMDAWRDLFNELFACLSSFFSCLSCLPGTGSSPSHAMPCLSQAKCHGAKCRLSLSSCLFLSCLLLFLFFSFSVFCLTPWSVPPKIKTQREEEEEVEEGDGQDEMEDLSHFRIHHPARSFHPVFSFL